VSRRIFFEGMLFLVIGLVNIAEGLRLSFSVRQPGIYDIVGPDRYSLVVGFALVATATIYILAHHKQKPESKEPKMDDEGEGKNGSVKVVGIVGILTLYAILIPTTGYSLASIVFFLLILKILGVSSWIFILILSIGMTLVYYLIFACFLGIILPRGFMGF